MVSVLVYDLRKKHGRGHQTTCTPFTEHCSIPAAPGVASFPALMTCCSLGMRAATRFQRAAPKHDEHSQVPL